MDVEIEVVGKGKARAKLDGRNPETADRFYKSLPLEGKGEIMVGGSLFHHTPGTG